MSVTVYQQPSDYTPCFSPQVFTANSNQYNQANFTYTVKCTDLLTSTSLTYEIEPRPDSNLVFDAARFSQDFIDHYVANNEYGFQPCVNGLRDIRVNIGETYGSTPSYASGTDIDFKVWNAGLSYLDYPDYTEADFVYNSNTSNFVYLTSLVDSSSATFITYPKKTYSDKSLYFYALTSYASDVELIRINTYDSGDNLIGTSDIANPYESSANYYEKFLCLDIGYKGLSTIASTLVTGTYPIITSSVSYYDAIDGYDPGGGVVARTKNYTRVYIDCEPMYDVYVLHYLNHKGNFETINFKKLSEQTVQSDKTFYRQNPWVYSSNTYTYSKFAQNETVLTSVGTKRLKLNSDWLSEAEIDAHQYIINSPRVYIDFGSTTGLIPVKVNNNSYLINKKFNNKVFNLTIDVEYTHKDKWQNG